MKTFIILIFVFASIINKAQSPQLWGATSIGGTNGIGSIIKINGDGSGYSKVFSLADGSIQSAFVPSGNSTLYGNTVSGGIGSSLGSIFKYNTANGLYDVLFSFDSLSGFFPRTSLVKSSNGVFYGTASNGGLSNFGTVFSFNPADNSFLKLHDFDSTITGLFPQSDLFQASNENFYGMTLGGGTSGGGVIYSFTVTANCLVSVIHNFEFNTGFSVLGGSFVEMNGKLYGMTFGGGSMGFGVIFSLDLATNTYNVEHNFNGTEGSAPSSTLVKSDNGILYGLTSQGGINNKGTLFSFNPSTTTLQKLHDFTELTGINPSGSLLKASDGNLYGMTQRGGTNNFGVIFSFQTQSNTYSKILDLNAADGGIPMGSLIEFDAVTGIEDNFFDPTLISVYPSIGNGNLIIKADEIKGNIKVQISNVLAQKIESLVLTEKITTLNLPVPPGIYFATFSINNKYLTKKFIIK